MRARRCHLAARRRVSSGMSADSEYPSKPFVLGTIAYALGKKAEENKSHEWTVYLRAANPDEDLSQVIRKVVFVLHPTLQPPTRTLETAPFEVTEQGWGEFEISVQIFFHDSRDKPVELSQMLKLYPDENAPAPAHGVARPVVSERYDEFVFNSPSDGLRQRLSAEVVPSSKGWRHSPHAKYFTDYESDPPQDNLQQIYQMITAQLQDASKRRRLLEDENAAIAGVR